MAMSWTSSWIVAQAKEELEVLEALHPNRFGYLKVELKSFIAEESDNQQKLFSYENSLSSVSTQASCSRKRKSSGEVQHKLKQKCRKLNGSNSKGRVDAAIERALACLRKIKEVKRSFSEV